MPLVSAFCVKKKSGGRRVKHTCISILRKGNHKWYNIAQWAGLPREDGWALGEEGSINIEWNHISDFQKPDNVSHTQRK